MMTVLELLDALKDVPLTADVMLENNVGLESFTPSDVRMDGDRVLITFDYYDESPYARDRD